MNEDPELLALREENARLRVEEARLNANNSGDPELLALKEENDKLRMEGDSDPTLRDEIKKAKWGAHDEDFISKLGRTGARKLRDIPIGLAKTVDFFSTPSRVIDRYKNNGIPDRISGIGRLAPNIERIADRLDPEGYSKPQNRKESTGSEIFQTVAGLSPQRAVGRGLFKLGANFTGRTAKAVKGTGNFLSGGTELSLTNIGATGAGIIAREKSLENNPGSYGNALFAELAANMGTRSLSSLTKAELAKYVANKIKFNPGKAKDFADINMPAALDNLSDSELLKLLGIGARKAPFAGDSLDNIKNAQRKRAVEILGQNVDPHLLTQGHGGQLVGEAAKNNMDKYTETSKKLYGIVEDIAEKHAVSRTTSYSSKDGSIPLKTPSTNKFLGNLWRKSTSSWGSKDLFKESAIGQAANDFEKLHYDLNGYPKSVSYEELSKFMESWNKKIKTFGAHGDTIQGPMKELYGHIKQDIGNYFKNIGPEAEQAWRAANKHSANFLKQEKKIYNPIKELIDQKELVSAFNFVEPTDSSVKKAVYTMHHLGQKAPEYFRTIINKWGQTDKNTFDPMLAINKYNSLDKTLQHKLLNAAGYTNTEKSIFQKNIKALSHMDSTLADTGSSAAQGLKQTISKWAKLGVAGGVPAGGASYLLHSPTPLVVVPIIYVAAVKITSKGFSSPMFQNWLNKGLTASSDKMVPKWLEYGLKIPGIPKSVKEEMKEVYSNILKSEKAYDTGNTSKAILASVQGRMSRLEDK
jgi:hypothetical protein